MPFRTMLSGFHYVTACTAAGGLSGESAPMPFATGHSHSMAPVASRRESLTPKFPPQPALSLLCFPIGWQAPRPQLFLELQPIPEMEEDAAAPHGLLVRWSHQRTVGTQ